MASGMGLFDKDKVYKRMCARFDNLYVKLVRMDIAYVNARRHSMKFI